MPRIDTIRRRSFVRLLGAGVLLGSAAGTAAAAREGRYVVGTSSRTATHAAQREARSVRRILDFGRVGQAVAGTFTREALRGLSRRPDVRYVEPDGLMFAISIDASDAEVPWGVDRIDAEKAHAAGHTGAGAKVAVVDTGIDYDHPDLNVGGGIGFAIRNPHKTESPDPADYDDGNGHGTHCAGTIGAVDDGAGVVGVAPAVELYAVKVLYDNGSGSWSDVADGIRWAADNGMDVASMSLGGSYSNAVEDACQYASEEKGVLLVAAAGNDGPVTADEHWPSASTYVVSVGATDDTDAIASFSSTGSVVELSAPGVAIPSTWKDGGYNTISGTSMACPHVAGAGALLRAQGLSATEARSQLTRTAEDLGPGGRDEAYGVGLVDAQAATGTTSGGSGDTTAPTFTGASASDASDGDGTVASGDRITVVATVTDSESGIASVTADASPFGGASDLPLSNGGSGDTYTATFQVGATSATDGSYAVTVTATDGAANVATAITNALTLVTDSGSATLIIDSFTATPQNPNNPHVEIELTWGVSGSTHVELTLSDGTTNVVDEAVAASGTRLYQKKHSSGTYTATLTASNGVESVSKTVDDIVA